MEGKEDEVPEKILGGRNQRERVSFGAQREKL